MYMKVADVETACVCKDSPVEGQHHCVCKLNLAGQLSMLCTQKAGGAGSRSACKKLEERWERGTQGREGTDRGEGEKD